MDEERDRAWERQREAQLGFQPQRECELNWLLPYADQLDDESTALLADIKSNLGRAVMLREMRPAVGIWTSKLIKYLRVYGLKFSKEDHIALVKLVFELIRIPELEPTKLHKFFTLFAILTKRRYLLSRDDLSIPWRPLYDLGVHLFDKNHSQIGMFHYVSPDESRTAQFELFSKILNSYGVSAPIVDSLGDMDDVSLESSYESVVRCARPYFELSATKEILAEILPHINLWSADTRDVLDRLVMFLPVSLPAEYSAHGHDLWLDDILTLWNTCDNSQACVGEVLGLFSGLAKRNPGAVDWSPHLPLMFSRFLRSFNLPVCYRDTQAQAQYTLPTKDMAMWIVWGMSHDGQMLKYLRSFLTGIESYLHSANSGLWSYKLRDFLRKLSRQFLFRVHRERDPKFKKTWENLTPESHCIRDNDIDEFVQILLEPSLLAVHSRGSGADACSTLQHLATLRPAIVVPPLLQKLYSSLESLTEPHRVTAAMQSVVAVARPMVRGAEYGYPAGPTHVVPILLASLPGIDPNDIKKTLVTLHLISQFSMMLPFVDCSSASQYWKDLTEEESLTCASTARFEDFVLMFFDRMFTIIESTSMEQARLETRDSESTRSKVESVLESALSSATTIVLMQSSQKIICEALRKFKAFATGATFETRVAGRHVGLMLRSFLRASPRATSSAFMPHLCTELAELLSTDEALKEQNPPRELLYQLLLLSHAVETKSEIVREYLPILLPVLDRALKMHCREVYEMSCLVLAHTVASVSVMYSTEFRSSHKNFEEAPEKWLPIREWGHGYSIHAAELKWLSPGPEDVATARQLVERYCGAEIKRLQAWLEGDKEISRERRHRALLIIQSSLQCIPLLRPLNEPPLPLVESSITPKPFILIDGSCATLELHGTDVRTAIGQITHRVQARLLEEKSDDTRSLECLVNIWDALCSAGRASRSTGEVRCRTFVTAERTLDGRGGPTPGAGRLRCLLADGALMQHQIRMDLQNDAGLGETGLAIMNALLDLSVYTYAAVRIRAQIRLHWLLSHHAYSCRAILPRLIQLLTEPSDLSEDDAHARLKGILFVLCGPRNTPLAAKQDWSVVKQLWPAVLRAPLSEKPSIVRLENAFGETIARHFPSLNTRLLIGDGCVDAARVFVPPEEFNKVEFAAMLAEAKAKEIAASDTNEQLYRDLMVELVSIAEDPATMWRRAIISLNIVLASPNLQTPYPACVSRLAVNSLINDNITIRKAAIKLTLYVLKQTKQKHKRVLVDPYEIAGVKRPEKVVPGYRADNDWVVYSEENIPKTDEEWNRPALFASTGFYCWPEKLEVYAPSSEQPSPERPLEQMTEAQRIIVQFFTDTSNVEKLVGFLSAEDKKGKDKFSGYRFCMFKSIFRAYGEHVTRLYLAEALKQAGNSHEAPQRFAAEVAAASVRATKHWGRQATLAVLEEAEKVFRLGLASVTPESSDDWGSCLATATENIDPHRSHRILRAWADICVPQPSAGEDPDADADSSFGTSARLFAYQGALAALSWRGARVCTELLRRLQDASFIQHPYQNVRERVGSILMTVFDMELQFPGGEPGPGPVFKDFLAEVQPKLDPLYDKNGEIILQTRASYAPTSPSCVTPAPLLRAESVLAAGESVMTVGAVARLTPDVIHTSPNDSEEAGPSMVVEGGRAERELSDRLDGGLRLCGAEGGAAREGHARAVNLLTTLLRGTVGCIARGARGVCADHYRMIHAACVLSARGPPQSHDELARASEAYLACIAHSHHGGALFDKALDTVERVCGSGSWWARLSCVEFCQSLLFYGLPLLRESEPRAARAEAVAVNSMRDSRLEVRVAAAKLLTGLMHCGALPDESRTLGQLMKHCRSKQLIERHCGVLGLCAYVTSRPYTLGPKLGEVLAELCRHTNGPDPVPATIRQALAEFRRTHQDDWQAHREALTEDELDLLADLAAPPAYCA